jgi:hypothetical protein
MDRSFLSHADVIAASRQFVCIRLTTYEDAAEAAMLKNFTPTRSGEVENSVFGILAPNGEDKLVRSGRSIRQVYSNSQQMAEGMKRISGKYQPKETPHQLPLVTNVRLALDVAAADNQPLVVVFGSDEERKQLQPRLATLAWNSDFIGHFIYVSTSDAEDLRQIKAVHTGGEAIFVVQPNKFGTEGEVIGQVKRDATNEELAQMLRSSLTRFAAQTKTFQNHVREGHQLGKFWETKIPVTDPQEKNARERGRQISPK